MVRRVLFRESESSRFSLSSNAGSTADALGISYSAGAVVLVQVSSNCSKLAALEVADSEEKRIVYSNFPPSYKKYSPSNPSQSQQLQQQLSQAPIGV